MTDRARADVVVIGGGPTGAAAAAAARAAAGASARVVLVDDSPGGPRPAPLPPLAAALRAAALAAPENPGGPPGWDAVRRAAAAARTPAPARPGSGLLAGVEVVHGRAGFAGGGAGSVTVEVTVTGADAAGGPLRLPARRVVLATGTVPALPDVKGLLDTRHVTPDTLLDLDDLPPSVAVVGAGPRGVALAQALARLGRTVTLVEAADRVLPGEDPAVSDAVDTVLRRDGVRLVLGSPVVTLAPTLDGGAWVGARTGSDVAAELLVVATGRRPDLAGLDLPGVGVRLDADGDVAVDDRLRTSNPAVLAVGRVTGHPADGATARLAGANALARLRPARLAGPAARTRTVPTDPPVAVVGIGEARAARRPGGALVHEAAGPGRLAQIVVEPGPERRLLGVTLVAPGAPDAAAAAALALAAGAGADRLADLAAPGSALAAVAEALAAPARPAGDPDR